MNAHICLKNAFISFFLFQLKNFQINQINEWIFLECFFQNAPWSNALSIIFNLNKKITQ